MNFDNNVTLLNIANSVADNGSNFIPKDTVFTIETDGSGDFASLQEAINFLNGKYSNGQIIIHFGDGTFNIQSTLQILKYRFNIPIIIIEGNGVNNTTLNFIYTNEWTFGIEGYKQDIHIRNLNITTSNEGRNNHHRFIYLGCGGNVMVENITASNFFDIVVTARGASTTLVDTINISNCNNLVNAYAGGLANSYDNAQIIANNVNELFLATLGGFISISTSNYTGTNVTRKSNVTNGSINTNGYVFLNF